MDKMIHKSLHEGEWGGMTLAKQMGNIGGEVSRAASWIGKNEKRAMQAAERAFELFDLTIKSLCEKNRHSAVKEICRAREVFCDFVFGDNAYSSTKESLVKYYDEFVLYRRQ